MNTNMSGYLQEGATQSQIDAGINGEPDWQCGDCPTLWGGDVETHPCETDGCTVVACGDCYARCFGCGHVVCSEHRESKSGRWQCDDCREDLEGPDDWRDEREL